MEFVDEYKTRDEMRGIINEGANNVNQKYQGQEDIEQIQTEKNSSPFVAIREGLLDVLSLIEANNILIENNESYLTADKDSLIRVHGARAGLKIKEGKQSKVYCSVVVKGPTSIDEDFPVANNEGVIFIPDETTNFTEAGTYKVLFKSIENGPIISGLNTINNILKPKKEIESVTNNYDFLQIGEFEEKEEDFRRRIGEAENNGNVQSPQKLQQDLIQAGCTDAQVYYNDLDDFDMGVSPHHVGIVISGNLQKEKIGELIVKYMSNCTCQTDYILSSKEENRQSYLYQRGSGQQSVKWCLPNNIDTSLYFTLYKTTEQIINIEELKTYIVSQIYDRKVVKIKTEINVNQIKEIVQDWLKKKGLLNIGTENVLLSIDGGETKTRILIPKQLDDYYYFSTDKIEIIVEDL